jgi:hypothetical protein
MPYRTGEAVSPQKKEAEVEKTASATCVPVVARSQASP